MSRIWSALKCVLGFHRWAYTPDNKYRRCLRGFCGRVEHKVWIVESDLTGSATVVWKKGL